MQIQINLRVLRVALRAIRVQCSAKLRLNRTKLATAPLRFRRGINFHISKPRLLMLTLSTLGSTGRMFQRSLLGREGLRTRFFVEVPTIDPVSSSGENYSLSVSRRPERLGFRFASVQNSKCDLMGLHCLRFLFDNADRCT